MDITLPKILSLVIATGYLVLGALAGVGPELLKLLGTLVIPLAFIWFPEILGSFTGSIGRGGYVKSVPASFISAGGWFMLVGLPVLMFLISALFG